MKSVTRKAKESDVGFFLEAQNYKMVNRFYTNDKESLAEWFKNHLSQHFIIEIDGEKAGIFRLEEITAISIAIKTDFRRIGLASQIISKVKEHEDKVIGFIDSENNASKSLFESLGFKKEIFDCYSSN